MGLLTAALVDAAIVERDRRLKRAAKELDALQPLVGGDGAANEKVRADRETIVTSCQCWSAIVTWLESDRFESFIGGETTDGPIIRWPELEAAAARALAATKNTTEAELVHRARLMAVHAKLARMRSHVDFINAEFRREREHSTREDIAA